MSRKQFSVEQIINHLREAEVLLAQGMVLLRINGELFAHSRPAISNWTGLWYPSVECRRIGL